ncbi:hypothetical protein Mgra_00009926 [Meloidogyne graminicola]|uniref:Uncharacterized protein n=1 Tax=Meloidogyne graminicola TaxID=189291 RepID=A0A8S9ZCV4_9BILA|nr:hypothetical protein Mgra_00009926 [Meloidogyne graminicola]
MSDAKLGKILELLESRNRILRSEAISTLIQYAPISLQQTMYSWDQLFNIVTKCFRSSLWECRVASAELLSALLEITNKSFHEHFELLFSRSSGKMKDNFDACATLLNNVDLCQIELDYNVLLGFEENNDLAPSNRNKVLQNTNSNSSNRKKQQRQLIDQHLDMNSATGVSSSTFITDDEIVCSSENNGLICTTGSELEACRKELYEEMSILDNKSDFFKSEKPAKRAKDDLANAVNDYDKMADIESDDQKMRLPMIFLKSLCEFFQFTLLRDLVNPRWQTRHGAALVLAQICNHAGNLLFYCPDLLTVIITRLLHLLCMDRFCDFVTGSNVVAPVREATAQAFSFVLLKLSDNFICKSINHEEDIGLSIPVRDAMLNQICNLLLMKTEQNWHCRQSALLVAKYHFTLTTFSLPSEHKLFDLTLCALECDPVDEVISASSQALCSFFLAAKSGTTKFNSEFLAKIGQKTPLRLWKILQHPKRLSQLREGVDSVLVDLLGLLEFCLCTNWQDGRNTSQPSTQININQLTTMIELLECSPQLCPTERNIKVLQCLCAIFENDSLTSFSNCVNEQIWTDKLIFQTLKRLYRCVLFCPPSSAEKLLSGCQTTMRFLLNFFQRHIDLNSTLDILLGSDLSLSIGRWISCLMYDHRNPEIDVFLHNVDGWDSRRDIKELLCGVELHFMDKKQIDITIIERKAMAAEFLAPLIYALYRWGRPLGQQSMFVSLQLLFFPYLRSNSLYQKLGSALLVERWATVHHRNMQTDRSLIMPDLLIKELYEQLFNDANSGKLFDEVKFFGTF